MLHLSAKLHLTRTRDPAHFLRFLSSLHVFKEVSPDHFAHNRVSHQLDTGKAVSDILAKYVSTPRHEATRFFGSDLVLSAPRRSMMARSAQRPSLV